MRLMSRLRSLPVRNLWRVAAFDVAAPGAAIAALVMIGVMAGWPLWWVAICSVLVLLIVEAVVVNVVLWRRDTVTVGTDDDGPALRLGVAALCVLTLLAAVFVGYTRWTVPDRDFTRDSAQVVRIAVDVAEATATFSPQDPSGAIDRAAAMMVPERAEILTKQVAEAADEMVRDNVTAQAATLSAGLEAIGATAASVAVILRGTRTAPGRPADRTVLALRVALTKQHGRWLVLDVAPMHSR